jgi:tetratricopeptide (TPR) repeat protein
MAGDPDRAEQLAAKAHEIGTRMGQPDAAFIFSAQFLEACWQRGNLEELIPLLEVEVEARPGLTPVSAGLAMAHAEAGATEVARGLIEDAANSIWDEPVTGSWLVTMTLCSEVAILSHDSRLASSLFARLLPWSDQVSAHGLTAEGPVSHYLGGLASVLGRLDEADTLFARANAFNTRANAKFFAARTNLQWGVLLAKRRTPGDNQRARALLDDAHGAAIAHGYTKVALQASIALQNLAETGTP